MGGAGDSPDQTCPHQTTTVIANKFGSPNSLEGRCFKLWSTGHVKYCTVEAAPTKYIEFYDPKFQIINMCRRGQASGHIYAVSDDICDIDPFFPPENAGLKTVRIGGNDERHTFDAQFLDDDHLILQILKDLVFYRQEMKPPSEAPDVFTYYGICEAEIKNEEREIQKVKAALAETKNSSKKKSGPLKSVEDRLFRLFSTDHIQYCYYTYCPTTYIEFYAPEGSPRWLEDTGRREPDQPVEGHVYLIHEDACNVDPFVRPEYPSTKFHQLKVDRGRRTVEV
ncbi:hypothetical protein FDENT_1362 [Fusarium denticulatum]|uniref:Uncharacterized protein n=1 Tax=Fusarium denticulatum TaxID=48507 RepID=A0A8H5XHY8_9HYPO|nr:hypothetical protein FDENT_1362 [Fusarium denticulatum]